MEIRRFIPKKIDSKVRPDFRKIIENSITRNQRLPFISYNAELKHFEEGERGVIPSLDEIVEGRLYVVKDLSEASFKSISEELVEYDPCIPLEMPITSKNDSKHFSHLLMSTGTSGIVSVDRTDYITTKSELFEYIRDNGLIIEQLKGRKIKTDGSHLHISRGEREFVDYISR